MDEARLRKQVALLSDEYQGKEVESSIRANKINGIELR